MHEYNVICQWGQQRKAEFIYKEGRRASVILSVSDKEKQADPKI